MKKLILYFVILSCLSLFAAPIRTVMHYDGTIPGDFTIDGTWDPATFDTLFVQRSLEYDKEAHALDYQMIPKQDKLTYLLKNWRQNGLIPTERMVIKMRNLGDGPVHVYVQWAISREDVPGATKWYGWLFRDTRELPADGQWHDLTFNTSPNNTSYSGAATSQQPIYGPDGRLDIGVSALPTGKKTHFQIAEIRGEDDVVPAGKIQLSEKFPAELTAGSEISIPGFSVAFQGRAPFDQDTRLVFKPLFKDDSWPTLKIPLDNVQKDGMLWKMQPCTLALTPFMLDGEYKVTLECGESVLEDASFNVYVHGRKSVSFPNMSVREFGGRPTIFKGEEPLPGVMRATYAKEGPKNIRAFSDCGISIFGFSSTPTESYYTLSMQCEYAPGKYNYQQFDNRMHATLDVNPDAMLIVRLYLHAPRWWTLEHPDDISWTGDPTDPNGAVKPLVWHYGMKCPSWASRAWRDYTREGLRRMMEFMSQTPYADHIAGFVLASGTTEEWMDWAFDRGAVPDYSPAARMAFRQWLTNKYKTDQALQQAWMNPTATLSTVELPTAYERASLNHPGYMDPSNPLARKIADYNRYHSENVAECIAELCQEVKESTQNRLLVGPFYGYEVELAGTSRELLSGHIGVGKLLNCPYVDYLCSPTGYEYRQIGGDGMSYSMGPADSLQLHNKFWFIENDLRTSATGDKHFGGAADVKGDILQQTKESMHNLLAGMAQWWFDVGYVRFVDKELMDCIKQCVEIMNTTTLKYTRKPVAQVAMIIDEESIDWTTQPTAQVGNAIRGFQRTQLATMGTPYEVYLSNDLANLPERIRIIFLPMNLVWKPEHKAALDKFLTDGRAVCFIGTPGVIPPAGMTRDESAQAFTGLPLRFVSTTYTPICMVDTPDNIWLPETAAGKTYNNSSWGNAPNSNIQAVLDASEGVHIWGHYINRTTGKTTKNGAIGVKELPNAYVFFSGVSNLPREFLEVAYAKAGVHRYIDTPDQVWATENVFAVCVKKGGSRMIKLPKQCTILKDLFTGETFKVNAENMVSVQFDPRQTRAFLMENITTDTNKDTTANLRDIGGMRGIDGKSIPKGMLIRSGVPVRDNLENTLKIKTEIDLRNRQETDGRTASYWGNDVQYKNLPIQAYSGMHSAKGMAEYASLFRVFANQENYPINFHCVAGADRTGTVAFLLEALLGCSMDAIISDYTNSDTPRHSDFIERLAENMNVYVSDENIPLQWKAEQYLLKAGVNAEDIHKFQTIILGPDITISPILAPWLKLAELKKEFNKSAQIKVVESPLVQRKMLQCGKEYAVPHTSWSEDPLLYCGQNSNGSIMLHLENNSSQTCNAAFKGDSLSASKYALVNTTDNCGFFAPDGTQYWTPQELSQLAFPLPANANVVLLFVPFGNALPEQLTFKDLIFESDDILTASSQYDIPVIDGKLDDAIWQNQTPYQLISLDGSPANTDRAWLYLGTNPAHDILYIAVKIEDDSFSAKTRPHDGDCWLDDEAEIFIGAAGESVHYQLIYNRVGSTLDGKERNTKWNMASYEGKTAETEGGWILEVAIPLEQFHLNNALELNVCTTDVPRNIQRNLGATGGNFHNREAFKPVWLK